MAFEHSTQRHRWMYSLGELSRLRKAAPLRDTTTHFLLKISQLCQFVNLDDIRVEATALMYFQRVYLRNDIQHDAPGLAPKTVVLACIYLAAKVEEWKTLRLESLLRRLAEIGAVRQKLVVETELKVLQAMSFHITVFHPFQCHSALLREISQTHNWKMRLSQNKQASVREVLTRGTDLIIFLEARSLQLLKRSYLMDACFLYSPAQLALASVIAACHMPGIRGSGCPSEDALTAMKHDIGLFVEGYFRKFPMFELLTEAVQGAARMMTETVDTS